MFLKLLLCIFLFSGAFIDLPAASKDSDSKTKNEKKQSKKKRKEKKNRNGKEEKEYDSKAALPPRGGNWDKGPLKNWELHFDEAMKKAEAENKRIYILAASESDKNFRELKKRVFSNTRFRRFTERSFVLLFIDPVSSKLPSEQIAHNSIVKKRYKFHSKMPSAVIVDPVTKKMVGEIHDIKPAKEYVELMRKHVK